MKELYEDMVRRSPKLARGTVWCVKCGRELAVEPAECLRKGWPKCCGETMTIDSPVERGRRTRRAT